MNTGDRVRHKYTGDLGHFQHVSPKGHYMVLWDGAPKSKACPREMLARVPKAKRTKRVATMDDLTEEQQRQAVMTGLSPDDVLDALGLCTKCKGCK